ncbi:glyoxalase superfamily protein [Pseudomonas entomophila]|uniref:glyoxalase superfamily protein n=1 Tax=Pseudomonas entomophila TaxID=312306 RepID=UPI00200D613D|nr:glyoxalase superfamily protein [Pseudomonas entomophila]
MLTTTALKEQSKRLRNHLAKNNIVLSHSQCLEAVAALHGHRDWNTASAVLGKAEPVPDYPDASLQQSPVSQSSTGATAELSKSSQPEYPAYQPLKVINRGVGSLAGCLNAEGKLLVENTDQAKLLGFMLGDSSLQNPENLLIVLKPSKLAGHWKCEGRDHRLGSPWISPPFIFSLEDSDSSETSKAQQAH